ncbi:MAG: transporter [Betaproteobacteria bacterium]|nr:transporter [Betaproteobacteria bacterium]
MALLGSCAALVFLSASDAWACATCGCSLSTDAAMGYQATSGGRASLQYDYLDQSQLRHGTHAVSTAQVAALNPAANQEVEHDTINRYTTLGVAYSPNADWNIALAVPYVDRSHATYSQATSSELTGDNLSAASFDSLGDIKTLVSYQGFLPLHSLGVQVGIKWPTGRYGGNNTLTGAIVGRDPIAFSSGPNRSQVLDTSLQPGTGSTDLIVGAYYYKAVSQDFDAFVNGQYQAAIAEKLDQPDADYRPGDLATLSVGLRDEASPRLVPQLQVNLTAKARDTGALADRTDTAGTVAYLSPGVSAVLAKGVVGYGFVQLPLYSDLSGYQLFPRWTATVGVSDAF